MIVAIEYLIREVPSKILSFSLAAMVLLACTPAHPPVTATPTLTDTITSTPVPGETRPTLTVTPFVTVIPGDDPILVGAGDISDCDSNGDEATADLLDDIPGTIFTTGDNAYPDGAASDFANCYDPSWGRHKARTYPSPGNHDYHTDGATGYYDYFGSNAGDPEKGYYSYNLGTWHIIVLNSNIAVSAGSPQEQWLRADLAAHPVTCTLAYWHHSRFSSSSNHGSNARMQSLWQALYDYGADVVLGGHDHTYERFAPQDPQGIADPDRGIRQFVVGSGGSSHYSFGDPLPNSEVRNGDTFGVLKLTLHADIYTWEFVHEAGATFTDAGEAPCVTLKTSTENETLTFFPTDDATVKSGSPKENYGLDDELQTDNDPVDNFLIKFVVSGLNDRSVQGAKLRLYNVNGSHSGGDFYRVADNTWTEDSVTWNSAPIADTVSLASLGRVSKDSWIEIDLTSLVTGEGTYSLRISTTAGDGADYASKEAGSGMAPRLIISVGE